MWTDVLPQLLQILFTYFTLFVIPGYHSIICSLSILMQINLEFNYVSKLPYTFSDQIAHTARRLWYISIYL
jgi:hypothetical protein